MTYSYIFFSKNFNVISVFANDNLDTYEEFEKRYEQVLKVSRHFNFQSIKCPYENRLFLESVKGFEKEPEKGERCKICHNLNLRKVARFCKENGFEYFSTTLTISPHKDAKLINTIGTNIAKEFGLNFIEADLKKSDGFLQSVKLSKELNLYRQNYCGCIFSRGKSGQRIAI